MTSEGTIRRYTGQLAYKVRVGDFSRELPMVQVSPGTYIASDAELILGDVEFLRKAARALAVRVRGFKVHIILTAEAKSIALAFELSRLLGLERFIVARKSAKAYVSDYFSQRVKSITTKSEQQLLLTGQELASLSGRRVCLLDDVVSTGATFKALEAITEEAGGNVVCRAAIWKEGPWYKKKVVCVGVLPVFVGKGSPLIERI